MQVWDITEVRKALYEQLAYYKGFGISIDRMVFETSDNHFFALFGEEGVSDKVDAGILWCIEVNAENGFSVQETKVLYAGEIVERECFEKKDDIVILAEAVRDMERKAREYEYALPTQDPLGYTPHSFVTVEKNETGTSVIKWITIEQVYSVETPFAGRTAFISDIDKLELVPVQPETNKLDLFRLLSVGYLGERPEHLAGVHVEADVLYALYSGEREVYHIYEKYEDYTAFLKALDRFEKYLKTTKLERKWQVLAGMDIKRMDELAAAVAMEVYFAFGHKISMVRSANQRAILECLHDSESLEEYIDILTKDLEKEVSEKIKAAFFYLQENGDEKPLEILHRFMKPHLNGKFEVGKVYFALVIEECLKRTETDRDALVQLYDDEAHYRFVEKILYGEYVFMDMMLRDYPQIIQMEYGHGPCWNGNTVTDAYLKDNIYVDGGRLRPHGWQWEIIPVRFMGYGEDNMPIVEYAGAWHV